MTHQHKSLLGILGFKGKDLDSSRLAIQAEQEQSRIRYEAHKELRKLHRTKKLPPIIPLWHIDKADIDLLKQPEKLNAQILSDGLSIIEDVSFDILLEHMYKANAKLIRQKKLYHPKSSELGISNILNHWRNQERLIPPTILVMDKNMNDVYDEDARDLFPIDGKHRLNVAYALGATHIPIIAINKQLVKIKAILGIP